MIGDEDKLVSTQRDTASLGDEVDDVIIEYNEADINMIDARHVQDLCRAK